jgi:CxxC motif-containing protein (DUF1111 family)
MTLLLGSVLMLSSMLVGCDAVMPDAPAANEIFDAPFEDLTKSQLAVHLAGDEEFARRFTSTEGVGPMFVATSCDACHPGEGQGHPVFNETRFGRMTDDGFDVMAEKGGPQLQNRAIPGYPPEIVPEGATGVTEITAPSVTGLGLLEAVDDETILALADPDDADGDGISGRPQLIEGDDLITDIVAFESLASNGTRNVPMDGRFIGRFGKKARTINLLHQTIFAYLEDMGLTTDFAPDDLTNVQAVGSSGQDTAPDPEVPSSVVTNVVFYLRTLRPPLRRNADDPDVLAGKQLFEAIQCAACHRPTLTTGRSNIPQLNEKDFHPYTDLLLHDMGERLDDGYTEGRALTSEWRTPPLWGLGLAADFQGGTPRLLHDGRATSIREAIDFHGGEAAESRDAFNRLSAEEQGQLIQFLESL